MKLLVFSSLFPNSVEPHHGIFVANRLARWRQRHEGLAEVLAPVPWAPPLGRARWLRYRAVPERETFDELTVHHPRYASPPGFGDRWRGQLMAAGVGRRLEAVARSSVPDLLDAHYAYPDGVAAALLRPRLERALGRRLPLLITCRGSDLNLLAALPAVRPRIAAALRAADRVICVAEALRAVALELGVPPEAVLTLRNGVDVMRFTPGSRQQAREATGLPREGQVLLCVGHLIERKGQQLLLRAYARVHPRNGPLLVFVGAGEQRAALVELARTLGLAERVRFVGAVAPELLPDWYRAADALLLASLREGWPNVVLEALACGTPVIATEVWGTPEILRGCPAGLLVPADVEGLATGLARRDELQAAAARPWAEGHTWDATVDGLAALYDEVCEP